MSSTSTSMFTRRKKRDPWADKSTETPERTSAFRLSIFIILAVGILAALVLPTGRTDGGTTFIQINALPDEASPEYQALVAAEPLPVVQPLQVPDLPADRARAINAAVSFVAGPMYAPFPFVSRLAGIDRTRATDCLAAAMWYEAGADWEGQRAVAQVVLNRVRHPAFPHTVCGVVFQGSERATGCQFSFTCDKSMQRRPDQGIWERTRLQAQAALNGSIYARVGFATHYHTDWVAPYWSGSLDKITAVRTHLFFRWKGGWGRPVAFVSRPAANEPVISIMAVLSSAHGAGEPLVDFLATDTTVTSSAPMQPGSMSLAREQDLAAIHALPALRGAQVLLVHPEGDSFLLSFDPGTPPGAYALAALDLCKEKSFCKVMGWRDSGSVPGNFPIAADADRAMTFVYLRQNGQEFQRWNCSQISNPPGRQCRNPAVDKWDRAMN
jgi:hypothetical protein